MTDKEFQLSLELENITAQKIMYENRLQYINDYLKEKWKKYSGSTSAQYSTLRCEIEEIYKDLYHKNIN